MADILPFKKPKAAKKHRGNTLCGRNFHQWITDKQTRFDTQQGKLITRYVCQRCGKSKVESN